MKNNVKMEIIIGNENEIAWSNLVNSTDFKNDQNQSYYQFEKFMIEFSSINDDYSKKLKNLSDRYQSIMRNENNEVTINLFNTILDRLNNVANEHNAFKNDLSKKVNDIHLSLESFEKERKDFISVHHLNVKDYEKSQKELKTYHKKLNEIKTSLNCFSCSNSLKAIDYKNQLEIAELCKKRYSETKLPEDLNNLHLKRI
jgi:hypothetical protein